MNLRLLVVVLSLFFINSVKAQVQLQRAKPTIGIGRLQVSLNENIPLYKLADDELAFDTLRFTKIEAGLGRGKYVVKADSIFDIRPYIYKQEYSFDEKSSSNNLGKTYRLPELVFRAVDLTKDGIQVVINELTLETCIIKRDSKHTLYTTGTQYWSLNHGSETYDPGWILFESWSNYLKRLAYVSIRNPRIHDHPDGKVIFAPSGNMSFVVVYAINNWVKVKLTGEMLDGVHDEGWIRWTDGRTILVTPVEEVFY